MAPMPMEEEGGEGSGSRSRAREGRRGARARGRSPPTATTPSRVDLSEQPASSPRRRAGTAKEQPKKTKASKAAVQSRASEDALRATSNSPGQELDAAAQASASAASKQPEKKRPRDGKERSKKRRRVKAAESEENAPRRSKRQIMSGPEAEAPSASTATEQASDDSSALSSPLRRPYMKSVVTEVNSQGLDTFESLESLINANSAILDAYDEHDAKYSAKLSSQLKLVTLERVPHSCLENPWYGPTRDSAAETVLKTAKVVLGLSSYIDGKLLKHASGFIIEWDKESKVATVLTSALLICTKSPSIDEWLAKDEFAPHAEVHAHLLDKNDTIATAQLIHYHKHYNFALFKIKMDVVSQIPSLCKEIKYGQQIFVLGRDENQYLMVNDGSVLHKGPSSFNRHHNMFASCKLNECCLVGGPVVEVNGQFLGMISCPGMKFVPSAIILKCLHMLKKFNCIPRLHTGMKFSAIRFLDPVHREKITRKCNVDIGLIVTEVSEGSIAEKVGIRNGDIVECWNNKLVSTTFELENNLLCMCEEHLDNGNDIGSDVEIPVGIYRVRKDSRCTVILTLKVLDDVEVVATGEYDVSAAISAMVSPDDRNSGHEQPHGIIFLQLAEAEGCLVVCTYLWRVWGLSPSVSTRT
ncbi:hypothetical protein QOZ80_5BG0453260 [Eleusine coracana subsp. coracana]|nr:hypothetical protein QOZ80_5BG0453260 [Eleusine coracana subsp. coracana]